MTRSSVEYSPWTLFPQIQPPENLHHEANAHPDDLPEPPAIELPRDDAIFEVLTRGPLLPFDYCYLQGQREGLVPVVQTQLVQRNPRLVSVDRTPLGIDPNADLFRCFLMHGNPKEAVTVYTAYERDICAGVVSGYFHVPEIRNHIYRHYAHLNWLRGNGLTPPAIEWLKAYDVALDRLHMKLAAADSRERARLSSRFAQWLFPLLRRLDRLDHIRTYQDETRIIQIHDESQLTRGRQFFWDLLGDFTLLSIVSQPAFCAFAWMKQVQFPNLVRADIESGYSAGVGLFSPRFVIPAIVALVIGLLVVGYGIGNPNTTRSLDLSRVLAPALIGGLPALFGVGALGINLFFWLLYTSGSDRLRNLVPRKWMMGKPKNLGYLR